MTGHSYDIEEGEGLSYSCGIKVHQLMCKELTKFVDRITQIFPSIESAQPRSRPGIDALCSLNLALEKATLLIQHCTESSKLYLVITGEAIKLRCERVTYEFEQSLSQIQSMVPLLLAAQISMIVNDLKSANFIMESSEEEAGKILLHLLREASNFTEVSEYEAFEIVVLRLQLTSSKALLIERRSLKKLLDKVRDTDQAKERILKYLLHLLRKYGQSSGGLQRMNSSVKGEGKDIYTTSSGDSAACNEPIELKQDVGSAVYEVQNNNSCRNILPDEFKCPMSLRLFHDPVVIVSGQTFERALIEKWFEDGHDTCPKTQKKLDAFSIIPNTAMKDLISKWCKKHGISIPDGSSQPIPAEVYPWKTSSCTSISSFSSSLNNVPIRLDDSSASFGFSDSSVAIGSLQQMDNNCNICQSLLQFSEGKDSSSPSEFAELPWESQCTLMDGFRNHLNDNKRACNSIPTASFVQTLVLFFKDACYRSDVKAQKIGAAVLQIFVIICRKEEPSLCEDVLHLLVSFLDSDITKEALEVIEVLSGDQCCKLEVVASGVLLPSILKILESQNRGLLILALKILCNLSSQSSVVSQIVSLGYIPKLFSLLRDRSLSPHCIQVLKYLCLTKEGRLVVCEVDDFITSLVELLENDSREEQEHAVAILFSLCSHRIDYCQKVLKEGVIPSLVTISINGSSKGKEIAMELLRLLRDVVCTDSLSSIKSTRSSPELPLEPRSYSIEKQSVSKSPGYFRRKMGFFSKPRSVVLY